MSHEQPNLDAIVSEPIADRHDNLAKLEAESLARDGRRKEGFKSHLHNIVIVFMYFAAVMVGILFFIRIWHFAFPDRYCWLDRERLHDIERIIFSSAFITALSFYLKSIMKFK
jgi:hypothetical protein